MTTGITSFKPNPGINPAALPEWRKITRAINDLERHRTIVTGKVAAGTRTAGATLQRITAAVADVSGGTADTRTGSAPTGLTETATGYFDAATGNPSTQVVLSWTAPVTYTNGDPFTASGYEIWRLLSGGEWQFVTEVSGTAATLLRQPFGGATYQYEVRAQSADNGLYGDFSAPITVTPPTTLAALPAPSTPTLSSSNGIVLAAWDGLVGGSVPPPQFRGVYAEVATSASGPWAAAGQNLLGAGQSALGPYTAGAVQYVRFRAVDGLAQVSTPSASASITVVGVDLSAVATAAANAQTTANTALTTANGKNQITRSTAAATGSGITPGDLWWQVDTLASGIIQASWVWSGSAWQPQTVGSTYIAALDAGKITTGYLNAARIQGGTITGTMMAANTVDTNQLKAGAVTTAILSATAINGMTITGATVQTSATASAGIKLTSSTLTAYDGSGNATFTVNGTTGAVTAVGLNATTATISGAITATSGSITGTMLVSGTLATGTSGARVAITSAGLIGYNSAGTATFQFLTSSGTVTATGGSFTGVTVSGAITATSGSITGTLTIGSGGSVFTGSNTTGQASTTFSTSGITYELHGTIKATLGFSNDTDSNVYGLTYSYSGNSTYGVIGLGDDDLMRLRNVGGIYIVAGDGRYTTPVDQMNLGPFGSGGIILASKTGDLSLSASLGTSRSDFALQRDGDVVSGSVRGNNQVGAATGNQSGTPYSTWLMTISSTGVMGALNGTFQIPYAYANTITTRSLMINANGTLGTTSSSRRVKKNIKPLRWDDAMLEKWLAIKPVSFEYRAGTHEGDPGVQHGFVAEDVHDAGFTSLIYYDESPGKNKGRVDGFAYERMGVYDHLALGRLYDELMSLRQRVAVLEGA